MTSRGSSQLASDSWGWYVAIPTHTFGSYVFTLDTRAYGTKYPPLAPKYTIDVSFMASFLDDLLANFLLHFGAILLRGISGTFSGNFPDRGGLRIVFGSANE